MNTWITILGFVFAVCETSVVAGQPQTGLPLPKLLIALDSPEGEQRLEESDAKKTFLTLIRYFENQENLAYCGPASAACVLNASDAARPISGAHGEYRLFTQSNYFTPAVEHIVPSSTVKRIGMTLKQLGDTLRTHGVEVETIYASESGLDEFRQQAIDRLKSGKGFILINYLRRSIGQESGGHISPIGAYHAESDSFLILDVSKYKYPPVWIPIKDLWRAMSEGVDGASGKSRGYVLLSQ